jgi:xanthine phosphoribosyltransferase
MKALEKKILEEGSILPGGIIKVNSFLNQNIDVPFLVEIGKEIASIYSNEKIDKILTIESSGIAIAVAAAAQMGLPVLFAKKHQSANLSGKLLSAPIHSYTYNKDYNAVVSADFLKEGERILIVDDFLANGAALEGLISIAEQAKAVVVGAAIAIEKGFQDGGKRVRAKGIRVESLAIVESMTDNSVTFK